MDINYFSHLAIKKLRIKVHSTLEKKIKALSELDFNSFYLFLIKQVMGNLGFSEKGIFYKTEISKDDFPVITSHTRLISLLCSGYDADSFPLKSRALIEKLADYLVLFKNKNNLYLFNNYKWDKQDEGIASVWAAIALINSYEVTGKQVYLEETISAYKAMLKNLYSKETGLVHTAGQDFWCINASSKFAYLSVLILKYHESDEIKEALANSVRICLDNIAEDGHFPYTKEHYGVYILLYHASVMFYLGECLESEFVEPGLKKEIQEVNRKALSFLLKCMDSSGRFHEPEKKNNEFYIITLVTAFTALTGIIEKDQHRLILKNILKYYRDNRLFMFIDENDFLFNRERYNVKDVLTVETLYWLTQYICRIKKEYTG